MSDDQDLDPTDADHEGTYVEDMSPAGWHRSGFRFFYWGDEYLQDGGAPEPELPNAVGVPISSEREVQAVANATATAIGELVQAEGRWRRIYTGGAGDNGTVELIGSIADAIAILTGLLTVPGLAARAWVHVARLFESMRAAKHEHWNASTEVAILKCLAVIQEEWPGAYTDPNAIRVIQDGCREAKWVQGPGAIHVVLIPELAFRKTHIFVIDGDLAILSRHLVNGLTSDALLGASG